MDPNHCPGCGELRTDPDAPCPRCAYKKDPLLGKKLGRFVVLFIVLGILWSIFLTKDLWSN